jgi:hypothetical protein
MNWPRFKERSLESLDPLVNLDLLGVQIAPAGMCR